MDLSRHALKCVGAVMVSLVVLSWGWRYFTERAMRARIRRSCALVDSTRTIFVSVAAYREPHVADTLAQLFERAACPYRVFVGLCQHANHDDADALEDYTRAAPVSFERNVRVLRQPAHMAEGPTVARALIRHGLYGGEQYYLQIDAHTVVCEGWDEVLLKELDACASDAPVLTGIVPKPFGGTVPETSSFTRATEERDDTGLPRLEGISALKKPITPLKSPFLNQCFVFAAGSFAELRQPHAAGAFDGDDLVAGCVAWCAGWDFFHPRVDVVAQQWERGDRPTFWEQPRNQSPTSLVEVALLMLPSDGQRTLAAYERFTDVGLVTGHCGARALAGLTEDATAEERVCKVGSSSALDAVESLRAGLL